MLSNRELLQRRIDDLRREIASMEAVKVQFPDYKRRDAKLRQKQALLEQMEEELKALPLKK